jgi:hypothetical protein
MADDVLAAIEDLELSQYKDELMETLKGKILSKSMHHIHKHIERVRQQKRQIKLVKRKNLQNQQMMHPMK